MELEVIRCVADALKDQTIGVNAKLAGVPRDGGDPLPPAVSIADATRDAWVARRAVMRGTAAELPAIAVAVNPATLDGEIGTTYRDGKYDVLLEYVVKKSHTDEALRDGLYTLRAALRTIGELNKNSNIALRTRNGVCLYVCTGIRQAPVWSEREEAIVTAALLISYDVRDTIPLS